MATTEMNCLASGENDPIYHEYSATAMGVYTTPTLDFTPTCVMITGVLNGYRLISVYDSKYGENNMAQILGTALAYVNFPNTTANGIGNVDTANKTVTFLTGGMTDIDIYIMGY